MRGAKSFVELKAETGLSDAWLSKKLKDLASEGVVRRHKDRTYELVKLPRGEGELSSAFAELVKRIGRGLPLTEKARAVSNELARREDVLAVILFGSVAKGTARGESDIDLLIVTAREVDLIDEVYGLMARYDVPIEPVVLTYDEFLSTLASESVLLFSILEGYDVLADRGGVRDMLAVKDAKIRGEWVYDEEVGTWFRRSILRT